jgi:ribonuclease HI
MNKNGLKNLKKYFGEFKKLVEENNLMSSENEALFKKFEGLMGDQKVKALLAESVPSVHHGDKFPLPEELKDLQIGFALFADGACRGNPGPGSFGLVGQDHTGNKIFEASGVDLPTTNNKMELTGAIRALEMLGDHLLENGLNYDVPVYLFSDSKYVTDGITQWVPGWKNRGWKKADNKAPENMELWRRLDELAAHYKKLKFQWVKGHAGHPQNEYCDQLANHALDEAGY